MGAIVDHVPRGSGLEGINELCGLFSVDKVFVCGLEVSDWSLLTCQLPEISTNPFCVCAVLDFADHPVDVESLCKHDINLETWREKFRHDKQRRIVLPCNLEQMLADMNRSGVSIVKPEPIENRCHLRHVFLHILP